MLYVLSFVFSFLTFLKKLDGSPKIKHGQRKHRLREDRNKFIFKMEMAGVWPMHLQRQRL